MIKKLRIERQPTGYVALKQVVVRLNPQRRGRLRKSARRAAGLSNQWPVVRHFVAEPGAKKCDKIRPDKFPASFSAPNVIASRSVSGNPLFSFLCKPTLDKVPSSVDMAGSFLSCRACLLRTIRAATEATSIRAAAPLGQRNRGFATLQSDTTGHVDAPRTLDVQNADPTVAEKKQRDRLQRAVKKHLDHMEDPWKIAQHVDQTLAKDRFEEALLLTQRASKDGQVVVAWNHLIGYLLEKQQLKKAVKLFNEVRWRNCSLFRFQRCTARANNARNGNR